MIGAVVWMVLWAACSPSEATWEVRSNLVEAPQEAQPEPLPDPTEPRYAATHVLVSWSGAAGAGPSVTRTEAEAEALATALRERALAGEPLEDLARAHSDGPSAPRGGALGVYRTGTLMPAFEAAVASVAPGAVAPLVQTPYGWHVVRRDAVVHAVAEHIVVGFQGARESTSGRDKAAAHQRIRKARQALQEGAPFPEVAAAFSEDASAAHGGSLGPVAPGQLVPDFEAALFALRPGEISEVVETPYGLHLIRRVE